MKLQYLGTAAAEGWPGLFCRCKACREAAKRGGASLRTRSQAIVDDRILLDFPPDTYQHMLARGVDFPNIKTCLITHTHDDHFYEGDTKMRCSWFANDVDDVPLTFYGNDALMRRMETIQRNPSGEIWTAGVAWRELTEFVPENIEGYTVTPLLANHAPKEKCFNYIIEKDEKRLLYAHDTGYFKEETWEYLAGRRFDLVSLDCTNLIIAGGKSHMGIEDCARARERLLSLGCADERTVFVLNHFSHNGGRLPDGGVLLHEEIEALVRGLGFEVSFDGKIVFF